MLKTLTIGVVSIVGKGDLAIYRASVDRLKNIGRVSFCCPGDYTFTSYFFPDVKLLPHPLTLTQSKNLIKIFRKNAKSEILEREPLKFLSKMYDGSYVLSKFVSPFITKTLVSRELPEFSDMDVAVILGHTLEKSEMASYILSYLYPKFLFKKPTVIFPFSVSELGIKETPSRITSLLKIILRRIDAIFVREDLSYKYLIKVIGNRKNIFKSADTAFLLSDMPQKMVNSETKGRKVKLEKPSVAVALRSDYFLTYSKRYGINSLFLLLRKIAKILDHLISDYNMHIYFVPMTINPNRSVIDDLYVSEKCAEFMRNIEKTQIVDTLWMNVYQIKSLLEHMDFLITMRLHAGILAASKYVPLLMILPSKDNKANGIAQRLGIKDYFVDLDYAIKAEPEKLYLMISEAFEKRDIIREILKETVPKEKKLAEFPIKVLKNLV